MAERIDIGVGRLIGERADEPRDTQFHKKIVKVERIPNTKVGNRVWLECGHLFTTFGPLNVAKGVLLCFQCSDEAHANN